MSERTGNEPDSGRIVVMLLSNPAVNDPRVQKEAKALAGAGYRVTIVAWDRLCDSTAFEEVDGYRVERIRVRSSYGAGLLQVPALLIFCARAASAVRRLSPSVIHCHDLETLPAGSVMSRFLGCRLVFDAHEPNYFADARRLRRITAWIGRVTERILAKKADAVLVTNDYQVAKYKRMSASNVGLVANYPEVSLLDAGALLGPHSDASADHVKATDPGRTSTGSGWGPACSKALPASLGISANRVLPADEDSTAIAVGRVGALYYDMGIEELLEAYSVLVKEFPGLKLVLAGQSTDDYRDTLTRSVGRVRSEIRILGGYRYDELPALYGGLDVCVMPQKKTQWFEHITPTKFFEALCFRKPVVTTDVGGIGKIVREEQCGTVLDEVTPEDICSALRPILRDHDLRRSMGLRGFEAVKRRYNWSTSIDNLLEAYNDVIERAGRARAHRLSVQLEAMEGGYRHG